MPIQLEMGSDDFDHLCNKSTHWAGTEFHDHPERFEHATKPYTTPPQWNWKMAYWVGDSWAHVILARAFLKSVGEDCEVVWDQAGQPEFVVLTNYIAPYWKEAKTHEHN